MKVSNIIIKSLSALFILYGLYLLWAIFAFGGGCNKMKSETHILPNGYIGMVYVFFNQKEGNPKEYENDTRIYRIPKSGVLRTRNKANTGWMDTKRNLNFYYAENDSLIILNKYISARDSIAKLDSNSIVVFEYGIGKGWEAFGQGYLETASYIVDSLKNFNNREYTLTKERFENWNK